MNSGYRACSRCRWDPMLGSHALRARPWTDDDARFSFASCPRCGQISIKQRGGTGGVETLWILHPDADVMFRDGTAPSHIFDYVLSEDFLKNRGVTQRLFRGCVMAMLDLSGAVNVLVSRMDQTQSGERIQLSMDLFDDIIVEHRRRLHVNGENRMAVSTLEPLFDIVAGAQILSGSPSARLRLRVTAYAILEQFQQPEMRAAQPATEAQRLAQVTDLYAIVRNSTSRFTYLAQELDDEALVDAFVESGFLLEVLRRKQVGLDRMSAGSVWSLMHTVKHRYVLGSPFEFATKTYGALRALLEHQLRNAGFIDLGRKNQNGTTCAAFQNPSNGRMLLVPLYFPRVAIYATPMANRPLEVLDDYVMAVEHL